MTDGQFEVLASSFLDRHNLNQVMWSSFKDAVENSFTPKDLEKDPTRPVEPIERCGNNNNIIDHNTYNNHLNISNN